MEKVIRMESQKIVHQMTIENMDKICEWFSAQVQRLAYPIYSSYDIRDSGYKITNVDANIFPAGFNNICNQDKEHAGALFKNYLDSHYGIETKNILLVTEEHTQNPYYWDNVATIHQLMQEAGREVRVAIPKELEAPLKLISAKGIEVTVYSAIQTSSLFLEFKPDIVISNNDFSEAYEEWARTISFPMNPPRELGWYQRKKSRYFDHYNQMVNEFSKIAGIDPFIMRVETEIFTDFDIGSEESREQLAQKVDAFIARLKAEYLKRGMDQEPFVFVKNNAGTYGLAVIKVDKGDDVRQWTYKSRKKMKAAKGGRDVEEVIIQEGIPSVVQSDGASAEPVIYMIGSDLAGGFLRTHGEKSATESLNSPGAVYKKLCISDLALSPEGCPKENVYGWSAKLGLLSIAKEAEEMKVSFKSFRPA